MSKAKKTKAVADAAADLNRSLAGLKKLVSRYGADAPILKKVSAKLATMIETVESEVVASKLALIDSLKQKPAHFEGPAVVVQYFQDDDAPDRFMHGEPLVEAVTGPFKNSIIATAWAKDVAKLEKSYFEVLQLSRTPSPVPGADYYGGPVVRRVYDPRSTD